MNLHVNHNYRSHLWCGIGALSAATGIDTTRARSIIRSVSMRAFIKAVTYSEMAHAIAAMGYPVRREFFPRTATECPTLNQWINQKYRETDQTYVVCITGHWIVIRNDRWVDSMNHTPRDVTDCPYLRSRVRHVVNFNHTQRGASCERAA